MFDYNDIIDFIEIYAVVFTIAVVLGFAISVCANWKIFTKAGEKGWKSLIPFYSTYITYKICWDTGAFWAYLILSVVCIFPVIQIAAIIALIVLNVLLRCRMAKSYGRSAGFSVGLIFLPFLFLLILGFGDAKYIGPSGIKNHEIKKDTIPQKCYYLKCIKGSRANERFRITSPLYIGRDASKCNIVLAKNDLCVSRVHCCVSPIGDSVMVTDLNSTGGTFLDGVRLTPNVPYKLRGTLYLTNKSNAFTLED